MNETIPPIPPDEISDEARAFWAVLVPQLEETQDLRAVDQQLLLMYCEETVRYRRLRSADEFVEVVSKSGNKYRKRSPESEAADVLMPKLVQIGKELGIGVTARSKVSKAQKERYEGKETDLMSRKGRKARTA